MLFYFFLLAVVLVYLAGPKVSIDTSYTIPALPDDLDQYLEQSESRFDDLTPGTEKIIHWADPQQKNKTPIAFVYFHGFSATRQETMPVPDLVAQHFHSNIFYTRLTGNGRTADAVAEGTVNTWVNDASEAMAIAKRLGNKTIVIGCSTGASLGWRTACQEDFSPQTEALVFFSPQLRTRRYQRNTADKKVGQATGRGNYRQVSGKRAGIRSARKILGTALPEQSTFTHDGYGQSGKKNKTRHLEETGFYRLLTL